MTDTERLDWCHLHLDAINVDGYGSDDKWFRVIHHDGNLAEGGTIREAIDEAMAKQQP